MKKRTRRRNRLNEIKQLNATQRESAIPTSVELIQYNTEECTRTTLNSHTDLKKHIDKGKVNWFQVTGLTDVDYVSNICKSFGLHSFDIKDLLTEPHVVKFVLYSDVTFALVSGYHNNENGDLEDEQMAFILGDDYVISIQETPMPVFKEVEKLINDKLSTPRRKGSDFLLYVLLTTVNSMNNDLILRSEDNLFQIEDRLIMQQETIDVLHHLHNQRIAHMQLKRFMSSFREEFSNLLENENKLVDKENIVYFENLDDKLRTTTSNLDNYQESLMSLFDLYYSNNNLKLNEVMKRLTLVSTIFIPLTFLVGVWGMNFKYMPEIEWKYGYLMAWLIFLIVVAFVGFMFRKNRWF